MMTNDSNEQTVMTTTNLEGEDMTTQRLDVAMRTFDDAMRTSTETNLDDDAVEDDGKLKQ